MQIILDLKLAFFQGFAAGSRISCIDTFGDYSFIGRPNPFLYESPSRAVCVVVLVDTALPSFNLPFKMFYSYSKEHWQCASELTRQPIHRFIYSLYYSILVSRTGLQLFLSITYMQTVGPTSRLLECRASGLDLPSLNKTLHIRGPCMYYIVLITPIIEKH